jgi:sulfate adenylyltransferase
LPVILGVSEHEFSSIKNNTKTALLYKNKLKGYIYIKDKYSLNLKKYLPIIFGTNDTNHPGIKMYNESSKYFIGGKVEYLDERKKVTKFYNTPKEIKKIIKKNKLKTVAGFQTRNIPHKAHEYLHRLALEKVDGLLIQPLTGTKKSGDFSSNVVLSSYNYLIKNYYPKDKVILTSLETFMRYAGPREAVFHAIVRRNYGCTHFIVGRDHAGVSNYYGKYDAQKLCKKFESEIKIKILSLKGPYFCKKCNLIVTENNCKHSFSKKYRVDISGTMIRSFLKNKRLLDERYVREDIIKSIINKKAFIKNE